MHVGLEGDFQKPWTPRAPLLSGTERGGPWASWSCMNTAHPCGGTYHTRPSCECPSVSTVASEHGSDYMTGAAVLQCNKENELGKRPQCC